MLTIEGLTTDYGPVRAVDHVSFEVAEGPAKEEKKVEK